MVPYETNLQRGGVVAFPSISPAARRALAQAMRVCLSGGVIGLVLTAGREVRHVNATTMALALVLVVLCIALVWQWLEALIAALVAGVGLDYFFLPPIRGYGVRDPQHWVALFAFLATALATGQLSARTRRLQAEAIQGRTETEKLHRVSQSLWECDSAEIIIQRLPGALLDILGLQGVAVYDQGTDRIWRSGERGEEIAAAELRAVAASGNDFQNPDSALAIAAVHGGAQFTGSIGIKGAAVSSLLLQAIAEAFENAIARAQAAERAKEVELAHRADEFRAAVFDALAHEATGPLGTIEIATTMLTDRPDDTAHQHEILNIISAEVTRLRRWIGEMIQTSGAESGQLVLNKAPHNVRDLAMAAVQTLGHRTSGRRISMDFDKTLLLVECDSEIIRRVLHLLLDNGMKYSPSGSTVAMSSTLIKDPGMIVLSVADAGPGIPEDEQTRIFERHYRGSHNRSRVPGTGLGLASAKYLVESHGGRIWVTNRPEGGAAFHFSLPAGKEVVA